RAGRSSSTIKTFTLPPQAPPKVLFRRGGFSSVPPPSLHSGEEPNRRVPQPQLVRLPHLRESALALRFEPAPRTRAPWFSRPQACRSGQRPSLSKRDSAPRARLPPRWQNRPRLRSGSSQTELLQSPPQTPQALVAPHPARRLRPQNR